MAPLFLWALVVSYLLAGVPPARTQTTTRLALSFNTPVTLTGNFSTTPAPVLFSLPSSSTLLPRSPYLWRYARPHRVTLLASLFGNSSVVPGPNGGADVFGVQIGSLGLGNSPWGYLRGAQRAYWQCMAAPPTPIHAPVSDLPFFGDSTANEALLFSPPFLPPPPAPQPTFPNYSLPQANISLPPSAPPSQNSPNFTLFLAPLSAGLSALPQTACAVRAGITSNTQAAQSAKVLAEQLWMRDELGWRREWLVGQLTPLTNYSVYAIQDGTRLGGPIYFTTKSASFSCQLVHALPYCPDHCLRRAPPPAPPARALAYDASNLPVSLTTTPLLGYLTNFTASLLTTACGRDAYSPLQTCADCQAAYRHWLCSISLPRCGEFPQTPPDPRQQPQSQSQQTLAVPAAALAPQPSGTPPRNAALGNVSDYTALLPSRDGGVKDGGVPGASQDRWGNVFCNAS
ncbi:stretch-activated Ca2+-permeable channel component-domain-containing protein [Lactarius psammicola]|nr:stretch-activated Ca2+-permeable channel component-domain-containing protein [Lactarius psammicola]